MLNECNITVQLEAKILAWLLRLQCSTWRVHTRGREHIERLYADQEKRFLLCFWHGEYVPLSPLLEGYKVCVISSLSNRGAVIAEICKNFGYESILIPDKPSRDLLRDLEKSLAGSRVIATAVDGPLGPRHRVKHGLIWIAAKLGLDLLPISVVSRRKIMMNRRWDRLAIPFPFTTVGLIFGEPVKVSREHSSSILHREAVALGHILASLDKEAENMILNKPRQ